MSYPKSFTSLARGDYYMVEEDWGLLEYPHPYDPNRLTGTPPSGYGWPEDEATILLLAEILGARRGRGGVMGRVRAR